MAGARLRALLVVPRGVLACTWSRRFGWLRPRRPTPRVAALFGASVVTLLATGAWVLFSSSLLAVRTIAVTGVDRLSDSRVVTAAGVARGTPLADVDLGGVRERVGQLRMVESVRVHRDWPATLGILVNERVPAAAVRRESGYALFDRDGVVLSRVPQRPRNLPLIELASSRANPSGPDPADVPGEPGWLRVLTALPPRVGSAVDTVVVGGAGAVRLQMRDGSTVLWGHPDRSGRKARVLGALRGSTDARTYDLRSPELVTTE